MKPSAKALRIAATAALLAAGCIVTYVAAQPAQPQEKVIKITAKRFDYTPGNLTLKKGEPVILEFKQGRLRFCATYSAAKVTSE